MPGENSVLNPPIRFHTVRDKTRGYQLLPLQSENGIFSTEAEKIIIELKNNLFSNLLVNNIPSNTIREVVNINEPHSLNSNDVLKSEVTYPKFERSSINDFVVTDKTKNDFHVMK